MAGEKYICVGKLCCNLFSFKVNGFNFDFDNR